MPVRFPLPLLPLWLSLEPPRGSCCVIVTATSTVTSIATCWLRSSTSTTTATEIGSCCVAYCDCEIVTASETSSGCVVNGTETDCETVTDCCKHSTGDRQQQHSDDRAGTYSATSQDDNHNNICPVTGS